MIAEMRSGTEAAEEHEWEYAPPPSVYDLARDGCVHRVSRFLVRWVYGAGMHVYQHLRVLGREHVLENEPCVIAPNHSSHLDALAVLAALAVAEANTTCAAAAADYFFTSAAMSNIVRLMINCIPIDRTGEDKKGFRLCAAKIMR